MKNHGKYECLDMNLLPRLYLAYNTKVGGESGKVHAPVKQRWLDGDEEIVKRMKEVSLLEDEHNRDEVVQNYCRRFIHSN